MRLERSHFLWKNAIQVEKLTVEEMGYKIDKKDVSWHFTKKDFQMVKNTQKVC